jgi:hypothetical protein
MDAHICAPRIPVGNRPLKAAAFVVVGLPLCLAAVRWDLAHQRRRTGERL